MAASGSREQQAARHYLVSNWYEAVVCRAAVEELLRFLLEAEMNADTSSTKAQ